MSVRVPTYDGSPMKTAPTRDASAEELWADFRPIRTGDDYLDSLRGRAIRCFLFGELVQDPVEHPIIRARGKARARSINGPGRSSRFDAPNTSTSVCSGCGRTIGEIAEWGSATASRQHEIVRRSSARMGSSASHPA